MQPSTATPGGALDASRRFVRIRHARDDGFIEFDFAIGDPELFVELILPRHAFEQFMRLPGTETLSERYAERARQRQQAYLYGHAMLHA